MLRTVLVVGALVLAWSQALQAGIYYEQEVWVPPSEGLPARTTRLVGYISGRNVRMEVRSTATPHVFITRLSDGVVRLIVPGRQVYVEMPLPGAEVEDKTSPPVTITKTTYSKVISGYRSVRYDAAAGRRTIRSWMTTEVKPSREIATYWEAGTRLYPVTLTRQLAEKLPGFPIRIEVLGPQAAVTVTVTALKEQEVPESYFVVPRDYQPALTLTMPPERGAPGGGKE